MVIGGEGIRLTPPLIMLRQSKDTVDPYLTISQSLPLLPAGYGTEEDAQYFCQRFWPFCMFELKPGISNAFPLNQKKGVTFWLIGKIIDVISFSKSSDSI